MRLGFVLLFVPGLVLAQRVEAVFDQNCASCHETGNAAKAPDRKALHRLTTEAVYAAITTGSMKDRAQNLTDAQRQAVAEYIGMRKLGAVEAGDARHMPNQCASNPAITDLAAGASWNGWGVDGSNTRFQPSKGAGIAADDVRRLKVKWAFGLPGATAVYGQPSVVAGRVFFAGDTGYVYSVDAATGCVYWSFLAEAGVRNAVSVGPVTGGQFAAFFGDLKGNVYAVNARTGELLWTVLVDEHPLTRITGAPKLFEDRLYVPVASGEEPTGPQPNYPCCTFRGSVVALDASTGKQIWKTYTIAETPRVLRKTSKGIEQWGPAGGGVWNSPTIDPQRRALYIGTGDAYTEPAPRTTDGLMALDLATGKVLWSVQDLAKDAWIVGCPAEVAKRPENCPKELGPDYDFGDSPILKNLPGGRSILIAGQKSGTVWGHDPDKRGAVVWKTATSSVTAGPGGQIVWGGTADDQSAYFGLNSGGIVALQLSNGERRWFTPLEPAAAMKKYHGQDAAVSSIPGAVFSGGWDGVLRALSTSGGRVMWEYNMVQEYKTVNGFAARGGSVGSAGPTIAGGMLFIGSGYPGVAAGIPGNVLLAFGVE